MSRYNKVGKHKTKVLIDVDDYRTVKYHNTVVVRFNHREIILHSGGWYSATTKLRMNQTSNQFNLGFGVYQKNFKWFVDFNGETLPFEDNMTLRRKRHD